MRGRRPQPDAVKQQKAAVRSARHRGETGESSGSAAAIAAGDPPKWLKKDALRIWHDLAPTLRLAKLLTAADQLTFARYCRNFADWLAARKQLDRDGMTYEAESYAGGAAAEGDEAKAPQRVTKLRRLDPLFIVADRLERMLLAAEDRFGLNPAERQRIMVARSQTGVTGDLFTGIGDRRADDPAAPPAEPAQPIAAPIGFLN